MRYARLFAAAAAAVAYATAAGAAAQATQAAGASKPIAARFACNGGKWIEATFVSGHKSHVDIVLSDGRKLRLPQAMSGSGARYANADESVVFWNRGHTAFIEEKGKATFDGCTTKA